MTQFKKKHSLPEVEKLADSISQMKVNLSEQRRILSKHVTFHQGITKSNMIATRNYTQLRQLARELFVSPIYNYGTYANLKKRVEAAHEIGENLKFVLKDLDGQTKVHVGRLSRFLDHWEANSGVQGVQEIELSHEVLK